MNIRGIAHRGYPVEYPENTLSSFRAAIEMGFTHMELDVHLTKDEIPVVMHDPTIDRMTDGSGPIRQYTFQELQQFTIKGSNERVPKLYEVLELAKDKIIVSIELKQPKRYKKMEERVLEIVNELDMMNQVYFISFDHKSLKKIRMMSNEAQIGPLVNKVKRSHFRLIKKMDAKYFAVKYDGLKEKYVKKCEELGVQLVVWTVNTKEQMTEVEKYPSILTTTDELKRYKEHFYPLLSMNENESVV